MTNPITPTPTLEYRARQAILRQILYESDEQGVKISIPPPPVWQEVVGVVVLIILLMLTVLGSGGAVIVLGFVLFFDHAGDVITWSMLAIVIAWTAATLCGLTSLFRSLAALSRTAALPSVIIASTEGMTVRCPRARGVQEHHFEARHITGLSATPVEFTPTGRRIIHLTVNGASEPTVFVFSTPEKDAPKDLLAALRAAMPSVADVGEAEPDVWKTMVRI